MKLAERFGRLAFALAEPDAIIVCDWEQAMVLWYFQQVEGRRPDVAELPLSSRLPAVQYRVAVVPYRFEPREELHPLAPDGQTIPPPLILEPLVVERRSAGLLDLLGRLRGR